MNEPAISIRAAARAVGVAESTLREQIGKWGIPRYPGGVRLSEVKRARAGNLDLARGGDRRAESPRNHRGIPAGQSQQTLIPAAPGFVHLTVWPDDEGYATQPDIEAHPVLAWRVCSTVWGAYAKNPGEPIPGAFDLFPVSHAYEPNDGFSAVEYPDGRVWTEESGVFPNRQAWLDKLLLPALAQRVARPKAVAD